MWAIINIIVAIFIVIIFFVLINLISILSVISIKKISKSDDNHIDGPAYYMRIFGGYFFDEFIRKGGAKTEDELASFVSRKITYGVVDIENLSKVGGCSTFLSKTKDGHFVFGRNYDYWKTGVLICHTKPGRGRYESYSTVDVEFLNIKDGRDIKGIIDRFLLLATPYAPVDGLNEKGLAIACLMSFQGEPDWGIPTDQQTDRPDITTTTFIRYALDYCESVDEVIDFAKRYDMHDNGNLSCHYQIADANGNSAVLEWVTGNNLTDTDGTKRELRIYKNQDSYQCLTNYIITPGYYDGLDDEQKQGLKRYEIIDKHLNSKNGEIEDVNEAMEILHSVGCRGLDFERNDVTVWSAVYDLTDKKAFWTINEHYGDKNYEYKAELKQKKTKKAR